MTITDSKPDMRSISVADVALTFPHSLEILKKYDLDYCCGGKKRFAKVCEAAGLDPGLVWMEIEQEQANRGADQRMQFDTWDAALLVNFIVQHHHHYVRNSIPQIQQLVDKVCKVHGADSPILLAVRDNFNELADELLLHMEKEEKILFPAILNVTKSKGSLPEINLDTPIAVMEHEHDSAGHFVKTIRSLTGNYTPPPHACPTFKMTYIMLNQFDDDLMQHIHLENNILFPRVSSE
jgi:regulator of cell morphogenesis and NO signaling